MNSVAVSNHTDFTLVFWHEQSFKIELQDDIQLKHILREKYESKLDVRQIGI